MEIAFVVRAPSLVAPVAARVVAVVVAAAEVEAEAHSIGSDVLAALESDGDRHLLLEQGNLKLQDSGAGEQLRQMW